MTDHSTVSPTTPPEHTHTVDAELKHAAPKRKKTWGEHLFNWSTYGGVALVGNEVASFAITTAAAKEGIAHKPYTKFEGLFSRLSRFKKANGEPLLGEYIIGNPNKLKMVEGEMQALKPRMPYLLVATIGGMFMVPFVKYMEDHKGSLVRTADRHHYGALTDSDYKLVEAHKEMDESPKQSWGSLWKGRITTVVAAAAVDSGFGWDNAVSTKLFGKEASLNGLARATSRAGVKLFKPKNEEAFVKIVDNGTWLLTLSSTLTVLFYASSKLFAKKHDEKVERNEETRIRHASGIYPDATEDAAPLAADATNEKSTSNTPTPQVKSITREDTLATVPQLSQALT